jgi:hypothetical protein
LLPLEGTGSFDTFTPESHVVSGTSIGCPLGDLLRTLDLWLAVPESLDFVGVSSLILDVLIVFSNAREISPKLIK